MENASKALLMAGGILITVLIISLLVLFYNRISTYYEQQHEFTAMEQAQKFNAQFEAYNKDNLRGNELISFMNKIINYNATESYFEGTGYERIRVTITLGGTDILNQFKYNNENFGRNKYLTETITNTNGTNWIDDQKLIAITNTSSDLCNTYRGYNLNDTKLQQLSSNISNIIVNENEYSSMAAYNRSKRADLIEDVLGLNVDTKYGVGVNVVIDKDTAITKKGHDIINDLKKISSQYYQYTQFKRACFDCTEMIYDTNTNRVVEVNFKVQTEGGNVVFD